MKALIFTLFTAVVLFASSQAFGQSSTGLKQAVLQQNDVRQIPNKTATVIDTKKIQDENLKSLAEIILEKVDFSSADSVTAFELTQEPDEKVQNTSSGLKQVLHYSRKTTVTKNEKTDNEKGEVQEEESTTVSPGMTVTALVEGSNNKDYVNPNIKLAQEDGHQLYILITGNIPAKEMIKLQTTLPTAVPSTNENKMEFSVTLGEIFGHEDENAVKYPRFFGGITFSRIDWGFSRLMDEGKFSLSGSKNDLSYKKASNFGFDILQVGLRFNDNFKTYVSAGFEWNYLRLKKNILFHEGESPLSYEFVDENDVRYKKNVFTTTYLRLPLTFEWRSDKLKSGERVKIAFGAMTGVLLKGTQRLKSEKYGKQKFKDNYSLSTFQYGPFIRLGYDDFGIFAKYYMNDMFENTPEMKGLNNFTFGLTLGF